MQPRWTRPIAVALALAGPPGFGAGMVFISGRGTTLSLPLLAFVGFAAMLVGLGLLAVRRSRLAFVASFELLVLLAFWESFAARTPAPVARYEFTLPAARPPTDMSVHRIVTAVIRRTASFAYRGGGFGNPRTFTMNAVLVRHPAGDLLIDTGLGVNAQAHLAAMPLAFQLITRIERRRSARQVLAACGYDRRKLRAIVLTHAHWDHVSGIGELAPTPVWLPEAERTFMRDDFTMAVARSFPPERFRTYAFEDRPYLHFPRSRDVFGDGSFVIVPAPGHTPGSVIVFLALPDGRRLALLGDLAWQLEGVTLRSERPFLTRLGDWNPAAVRDELARMAAFQARFPGIDLVPAHDPRAYGRIPELTRAALHAAIMHVDTARPRSPADDRAQTEGDRRRAALHSDRAFSATGRRDPSGVAHP